MRDTDLLDMLERMDLEPDPVRALHALCTDLSRRVGAIGAGVATDGDGVVARTGAAEIPPAAWLRAVATGVGATRLVTVSAQMEAIAVTDVAGSLGALWVAWPAGAARPDEASDVLVACARLAAGRLAQRRALATAPERADGPLLVGDSAPMAAVRARLARAARSPFPVLIVGESGVGKELAARGVHAGGARRHRRFVAVNAAALPDDLLEAELFGHARGAFTGAIGERAGVFEEADGGTLFLDEVGELSLRAQAKLLRVLQEGEVRRLGEAGTRRVDVRLIAATNVALDEAVQAGRFRADLFYRLAVLCVRIPPLRERRGDVAALVARLWTVCARRVGTEARLHPHIVERLQAHDWPGNVRELENVLAMLAVDAPRRGVVLPELLGDFPSGLRLGSEAGTGGSSGDVRLSLDAARRAFDAALVQEALSRTGGRRGEAARRLGLSRQGLSKLVRRLGLDGADVRPS